MLFKKFLDESVHKPKTLWVDKGSEFYNKSMKSWLEKNAIEMYSIHNEWKSIISERFNRTLKHRVYKFMTSILKKCVYS